MSIGLNDMSRIAGAVSKLESSSTEYTGDVKTAARTLIRRTIPLYTAAVNANGNNAFLANAGPQQRMIANGRVLGAYFLPTANATAAATNNAVISVGKLNTSTGVTSANVCSQVTNTTANGGTGNLVLGVATTLTVTDLANARFTRGQSLGASIVMNGSGVAIATGTIQLDVELEGPADEYGT